MAILIFALLGAFITGGTAIVQYAEKRTASEKAEQKDRELKAANEKIISLNETIVSKTDELLEANKKIAALQNDALNQITGGKNLPVLMIGISSNGKRDWDPVKRVHSERMYYDNKVIFYLVNGGKYPLKDVLFSIKDEYKKPDSADQNVTPYNYKNQTFDSKENFSHHNIEARNLTLKSRKLIYATDLPQSTGEGHYSFDIVVEWSNGLYQAHVDLTEKDGQIKTDVKYYDSDGKELPKELLEKNINEE